MVHIPEAEQALVDLHRALRPNGILVFNIDSRPHGPTTEYHFFEAHYPVLKHMGKAGYKQVRKTGGFYIYQKVEGAPLETYSSMLFHTLRYKALTHTAGKLARTVRRRLGA